MKPKMPPRILWHGTWIGNWENIQRWGLRPPKRTGRGATKEFEGFETKGCLFFDEKEKVARYFGMISATGKSKKRKIPEFILVAVDTAKAGLSRVAFTPSEGTSRMYEKGREWIACDPIPPSAISYAKIVSTEGEKIVNRDWTKEEQWRQLAKAQSKKSPKKKKSKN